MTDGRGGSLVLRGAEVLDGSGRPAQRADVSVQDGRITEVADRISGSGARELDLSGLVVAPGFIDLHTHCDFTLQKFPRADAMVRQGVTTLVVGNCGHSTFPVGDGERRALLERYSSFLADDLDWSWSDARGFVAMLEGLPLAVNVALLVGHGTLRIAAMGFDNRAPGEGELTAMRDAVTAAMEAGAFGLSSGLIYAPGTYASTEEIVALAAAAGRLGGIYTTHMRNEGPDLLASVAEAIDIAERAGLPLEISHHKVLGRRHWGLTEASLALVDDARARGVDVMLDQYPYPASSTTLAALLPVWAIEGGTDAMAGRLRDPAQRARIRSEVLEGPTDGRPKRDFEPDTVMIASVPGGGQMLGRTIEEVAESRRVDPVDVALDLLAEHGGAVQVVIFAIGEEDIRRVMTHSEVSVASDGWTLNPAAGGCPHPRSYGTFVRVLGQYVRDEKQLSLAEAVRKMTSLPARRLGLTDRGLMAPGAVADLVAFDPATVAEQATFTDPHRYCAGVHHVIVGGTPVVEEGSDTGLAAGQVLRGPAYTPVVRPPSSSSIR